MRLKALMVLVGALFSSCVLAKDQLNPLEYLHVGQQLVSANGVHTLLMRDDGYLVQYSSGKEVWRTNSNSSRCGLATKAQMYWRLYTWSAGNCVAYAGPGRAPQDIEQRKHRTSLKLQDDGNLVITTIDIGWTSNTAGALVSSATNIVLLPGTVLRPGDERKIGTYRLAFQGDGNLVLYKGTAVLWASYTQNKNASIAQMQYDGNFVIYDVNLKPLWHTGTDKRPGAFFAFQVDGNLVIYHPRPIWARWGVELEKPRNVYYPDVHEYTNPWNPAFVVPIWSW